MDKNNRYLRTLEYFQGDEIATDVFLSKYAASGEMTPDDMHLRLAQVFANKWWDRIKNLTQKQLKQVNYFSLSGRKRTSYDDWESYFYNLFKDFSKVIPQGSVMASAGVEGIFTSLSNCFVVDRPQDSYAGILKTDEQLAQLMKRRGGVGTDVSSLRPRGAVTSNAAKTSTGAVSFIPRFSNTTNEVAQEGRRGALMVSIHVNHPDAYEFALCKRDEGVITGANISLQITSEFMAAVKEKKKFIQRFPIDLDVSQYKDKIDSYTLDELVTVGDNQFIKVIDSEKLYKLIVEGAHVSGDPGVLFVDTHWDRSPDAVYPRFRGLTTNPCGEIFMSAYDACRLIAQNLSARVVGSQMDWGGIASDAYATQILGDILVDLELDAINNILYKLSGDKKSSPTEKELWENIYNVTKAGRRTGSGFTGLADMIAKAGYTYGSPDAIYLTNNALSEMCRGHLTATIDLSEVFGSFEGYDDSLEYDSDGKGKNKFFEALRIEYPDLVNRMRKSGRRNVSWSTVAPTGTVSIMARVSPGLEPVFKLFYIRWRKITDGDTLSRIDRVDDNGVKWMKYYVLHPAFKSWISRNVPYDVDYTNEDLLNELANSSPWYKSTANEIPYESRIEMQSVIQRYITHSISSTINLPEDTTPDAIEEIYTLAYESGLKGITVFREGCKRGVIESTSKTYSNPEKRPKDLKGEYYRISVNKTPYTVVVGMRYGKPWEVFCYEGHSAITSKDVIIKKIKRGEYHFISEDVTETMKGMNNPEQEALARLISGNLRHGMHVKYVVKILLSSSKALGDFPNAISRVLKKYISDGEKSTGATCSNCGSESLIYEEGCEKCLDCGTSKC